MSSEDKIAGMSDELWARVDAYFFRILGLGLGFSGCAALLINNSPAKVFTNIYGVVIFVLFLALGMYSIMSVVWDLKTRKIDQ